MTNLVAIFVIRIYQYIVPLGSAVVHADGYDVTVEIYYVTLVL